MVIKRIDHRVGGFVARGRPLDHFAAGSRIDTCQPGPIRTNYMCTISSVVDKKTMQDQEPQWQVSNDLFSVHLSTSGRPEGKQKQPLPLYSRTHGTTPARKGGSRDLPRRDDTKETPEKTYLPQKDVDLLKRLPLKKRLEMLEFYNKILPVADENINASLEDLTLLKAKKAEINDRIREARITSVELFIASMHKLHSEFPTLILYPNKDVYDDILTEYDKEELFYKVRQEDKRMLEKHLAIAPNHENRETMQNIAEDSGVPKTFRVLKGNDWNKSKLYPAYKQMYFAFDRPEYAPLVWIHGKPEQKTRSLFVNDPTNTLPKEIAIQDLVDFARHNENVTLTIYVEDGDEPAAEAGPARLDNTSALMRQQNEAFKKIAGKYYGTSSSLNRHRTSSTMAPVWIIKIQ